VETEKIKAEPPWRIKITKVENGYILSSLEQLESGTYRAIVEVIEEDETRDELQAARSMLWSVLEHFAVYKGISIVLDSEQEECKCDKDFS
jgi:hypothetical protein